MEQVITLFDFDATDPGELSFRKGETLVVIERKYKLWWLCKNTNDTIGVVPRNHIRIQERLDPGTISIGDATKPKIRRRSSPISRKMDASEVVSQLVAHGCQDLTSTLVLSSFGEYPVSHGGFSDIYRGLLLNGTQVAVKALRVSVDSMSKDPKHLKHAARELHTWARCRHPNVIPLLGLAIFRERIGMIAPWMKYGNLLRYFEKAPNADRLNIIHCDLKGANVLVSSGGVPVLTDFGNSSLVDRTLGFTQTTSGPSFTVRWSAAEIIAEITPHTEASDIYALGMTIYEAITGKIPYHGKSEMNVIRLVTVEKELPERPEVLQEDPGTADRLWKLLVMCWSYMPAARPSADEVTKLMRTIASASNARTAILFPTPIIYQSISLSPLTEPQEIQRFDHSIQKHKAEEEPLSVRSAHEVGQLQPEEEAAKLHAVRAEMQMMLAAWERYERGWQNLSNATVAGGRQFTFYDIPWPVRTPPHSFKDLHPAAIEQFLLSPYHSATKPRKARLHIALVQWHPEMFAQRFAGLIVKSHRTAIITAVTSIARIIVELIDRQTDS